MSAHCPPTDNNWLANLHRNLSDKSVAGVYGRQVPTRFSSPSDKRDLLNTFGLDKRVQIRDTFFHNANSMMRRSIWEQYPFDEHITNIEDRLWGQQVINAGYKIIYEPEASVFHHHGIHQDNRPDRAFNVARILEEHVSDFHPDSYGNPFDASDHEVCAIIPMRASQTNLAFEQRLLETSMNSIKASSSISRVIVATDDPKIASVARDLGADVPFLRPQEFSSAETRVDLVLQHYLDSLEADNYFPDVVLSLSVTFPFRPDGLFDSIVSYLLDGGFDTVIAGLPEFRSCWKLTNGSYREISPSIEPRHMRDPVFISLLGLACASLPHVLRSGHRIGSNVGIYQVDHPLAGVEAQNRDDLARIQGQIL